MLRARHGADAFLPRSDGLKNASPTYSNAAGWASSATMTVPRQNSAWVSSSNPRPFATLATAVAPNSAARLRCEALACLLTNSAQAIPPAIAATRNAAIENHVGRIMLNLHNLGTGALPFGAFPRLRSSGTGTTADGGASPLAYPICRYRIRPAIVNTLSGNRAKTSFAHRAFKRSRRGDEATIGARHVVRVEQAADQRPLNAIRPGLSMSERPKSSSSAPASFASLIARQNSIGVPPRLLHFAS